VQPPAGSATAQPEVTAPKLRSVAGSVIIRRGDSLWRISKRVYGRGVRYTTIYLANQDQIRNPDLIWPGQVFSVPEKTESGEDADMSAVADRIPEAQAETR
jgi:nucleoid-associated protein YgaU